MQRLSKRDSFFVGLTLFSMFFGAGNLIFPPFLGAQAGTDTWPAMIGFAISAIGLPVLGVVLPDLADAALAAMDKSYMAKYLYDDNVLLILLRDLFSA